MEDQGLAVHRTIVAVDVEGFGDRQRTNQNQVAVRDGLYRAMREAFRDAGIPWADRDHEDRGDGMFILVHPEVPKSLFVRSLPSALAGALRRHNGTHPGLERIRLRMALNAGEVNYDEHGATGASINLTFRLLESRPVKEALADSPGVLAVITSSWFFEEVVRHSAADATAYHPVPVAVKETTTTGWICLPDHRVWRGPATPKSRSGSTAVTAYQTAAELAGKSGKEPVHANETALTVLITPAEVMLTSEASRLPVTVPLGRLPAEVRGRDMLLAELRRALTRKPRRRGGTWVLVGMGGLGKSTVALAVAVAARARGWRVWWVTASDVVSLTGGMLEVLSQLGAPESVIRLVREGAAIAPERAWEVLNGEHSAGQRWLLVFDNADNPAVLASTGDTSPADGTGWLRPGTTGMVLVTTRNMDSRVWGRVAQMRKLEPLDDAAAAQLLNDLAPGIHDLGGQHARELGHRLGGLPLALHLAGTYLASPFARWHSFAHYLEALDSEALPAALAELDDPRAQARVTVARTWELSLEAIATDGCPQARSLLFLLSCYAANTVIPIELLRPELIGEMLLPGGQDLADAAVDLEWRVKRLRDAGLRNLSAVGLINAASATSGSADRAVTVHPVVADVNRSRLLTSARSELPVIGATAVRILRAGCEQLDAWRPADWPSWRRLVPHLSTLLGWLTTHADTDILADLVTAGALAAGALWRSGNSATAERLARSCVAATGRLGSDNTATLIARSYLAHVVADSNYGEAGQLFRELHADQLRVLGKSHLETLVSERLLARLTGLQGQYQKAEPLYRQLLEDDRRILGDEHPETLRTRHGLARAVARLGRYSEAESLFLQLLSDQQRLLGKDHWECIEIRRGIARIAADMGRLGEAEQLYNQILADDRRILGDEHPHTLAVRRELTRVVVDTGRRMEAKRQYRRLLADCCRILGEKHPITFETRESLTRAERGRAQMASDALPSYSAATDP